MIYVKDEAVVHTHVTNYSILVISVQYVTED